MNRSVTHIAGPAITVDGRTIQRCSLCGDKLVDSKNAMAPVNPDGSIPTIGTWQVGRLIQVEGFNPKRYLLLPDTDKLPEDSCIDLVEG